LSVQNACDVSGAHPHLFATPVPPQVAPVPEHVPQSIVLRTPQPSVTVSEPHWALFSEQSAASVSPVQPHWFATPPPAQVLPATGHVSPQSTVRVCPQESIAVRDPQSAPAAAQKSASVSAHPH
jgi:hypothetical protein